MSNISYEILYGILRKEKYQMELQILETTFFQGVTNYLKEKQEILESQKQKGIFLDEVKKTQKQIENVKKILRELFEKRENKILQLASLSVRGDNKDDFSNILPEEKQFYLDLKNTLNNHKTEIFSKIMIQQPLIQKPKDIKTSNSSTTKLIRFLDNVPKFVGDDLHIYGPFNTEDVGSIPLKVADVLIKRNKAEEIKHENSKKNQEILPKV